MNKQWKRLLLISTALLICICAFFGLYVKNYYHANEKAVAALGDLGDGVHIEKINAYGEHDLLVFHPEKVQAGMIFYPGGKVEQSAYAPLMREFAKQGILCILVKMPFNLAVFNTNAAKDLQDLYPDISHWYIGGHSLGGSMAASYVSSNSEDFDGLILLAAYSTKDLTDTSLKILSIYGTEDNVLSYKSYAKHLANLGDNVFEKIISGGCHAYFGSYGAQKGDGVPSITPELQWQITAETLVDQLIQGN